MDAKFSMCLLLIVFGTTVHAAVMDGHGNPTAAKIVQVTNTRGREGE